MNREITISGTLIDKGDNNRQYCFFFDADTVANKGVVYRLPSGTQDADAYISEHFHRSPEYKIVMTSDFFVKAVEKVGGITVNGRPVNGEEAAAMLRKGNYMPVLHGIIEKASTMNLMFTVPSLLNSLSGTYRTNLPIMDAFKTIMAERKDFDKWKVDYVDMP